VAPDAPTKALRAARPEMGLGAWFALC